MRMGADTATTRGKKERAGEEAGGCEQMNNRRRPLLAAVIVASIALSALAFPAFASAQIVANNSANQACIECHTQFTVQSVDRNTACRTCHLPGFVGTHPYHLTGSNCGAACHPGWGDTLMSAVPFFFDSAAQASFANPNSKYASASELHEIHANPRWSGFINTRSSACASCHATAACDTCHVGTTGPGYIPGTINPTHAVHSGTTSRTMAPTPLGPLALNPPWTGQVGRGVTGNDETQQTVSTDTNMCASSGCHSITAMQESAPVLREDYTHAVGGNPEQPLASNAVTVAPAAAWRTSINSVRTANRFSFSNTAGSTHSITFIGDRIELIADRDPFRGRAEVFINGVSRGVIDLYAATTQVQVPVFNADGLPPGPNTITIRVLNQRQPAARASFVAVDAYRVYANYPAIASPTCISCHSDVGAHGTFDHVASQTVGVYPGPTPDYPCAACHSLNMIDEHRRPSATSALADCAACHPTYAGYTITTYDGGCFWSNCHNVAGSPRSHVATATLAAHQSTDPGTELCRACHGSDLAVIHDDSVGNQLARNSGSVTTRSMDAALRINRWNTGCLTCHSATTFPASRSCLAAGCHVASGVTSMDAHPMAPGVHVASGVETTVPRTGGLACVNCHELDIVVEHDKPSSRGAGNTDITCVSCHLAPYYPVGWADTPATSTCIACHPVAGGMAGAPHLPSTYAAAHDYSVSEANRTCATGAFCHGPIGGAVLGEVRAADDLHDPRRPGNATCTSCHVRPAPPGITAVPAIRTCTGCHAVAHNLPVAHAAGAYLYPANADCLACHVGYDNLEVHRLGCAGCHANNILTAASTRYLSAPGIGATGTVGFTGRCTSCHVASVLGRDYDPADPSYPATSPHYVVPSHIANGMNATATVGTAGARCISCHASGLRAEHGFTLTSGSVGCIRCHIDTGLGSATVVRNNWEPGRTCANCHGGPLYPHNSLTAADHDMSAAAATQVAIPSRPEMGCSAAGCHANTDNLATLHERAVAATGRPNPGARSCNVCHISADTPLAAARTGGCLAAGCHAGLVHNMAVHNTTSACLRCHEDTLNPARQTTATINPVRIDDIRWSQAYLGRPGGIEGRVHACVDCHNDRPGIAGNMGNYNTSNCVDCHNNNPADPSRIGLANYDPVTASHYPTATHAATAHAAVSTSTLTVYGDLQTVLRNSVGATIPVWGVRCEACHSLDMRAEHAKPSIVNSFAPAASWGATTSADLARCIECHEVDVDRIASRWTTSSAWTTGATAPRTCGGGAGGACHNMTAGPLHDQWGPKHDASSVLVTGTVGFRLVPTISINETFGAGTTWPTVWNRSDSTNVTVVSGAGRTGSAARITHSGIRAFRSFQTTLDLAGSNEGASFSVWYRTSGFTFGNREDFRDRFMIEVSYNGAAGPWVVLEETYSNVGWTNFRSGELTPSANTVVRFRASLDAATIGTEQIFVDDIVIRGINRPATSVVTTRAAISCMNNPNGANCHNVTDVASLHSGLPNFGCSVCHVNNVQHPTTLNCQSAGCHVGVNLDSHNRPPIHRTTFTTASVLPGTGFSPVWCSGCHDDDIQRDHQLYSMADRPCAVCHRNASGSTNPAVAPSAIATAITRPAGAALCTDCHRTVVRRAGGTTTTIHAQRMGWSGLPGASPATAAVIGGVQFNDNWSGHRMFTSMPGMRTTFTPAIDGVAANRTWPTPPVADFISNWSPLVESTTMMVTCNECHGSISGAVGPHGAAMRIRMHPDFPAPYTSAYITAGNQIRSNIPGAGLPICARCHDVTRLFDGGANADAHNRSDHKGPTEGRCINCHVRTPHAWIRPRLIGYVTDPPAYQSLMVTSITDRSYTPTGWQEQYCGTTGCQDHPLMANAPIWP